MKRILLINPNTSQEMTDDINEAAQTVKDKDTILSTVRATFGPISIESHLDELHAGLATIEAIVENEDKYDAFIIACYSDPGLFSAREITAKPVIGIGEASMLLACSLGWRISLIATLERDIASLKELVLRYGLGERCASIRATGYEVTSFSNRKKADELFSLLIESSTKAIETDGAEVLCLACAGMVNFYSKLETELKVPVIEPVAAGVKWAELLVDLKLTHSQINFYKPITRKIYMEKEKDENGSAKKVSISLLSPAQHYLLRSQKS